LIENLPILFYGNLGWPTFPINIHNNMQTICKQTANQKQQTKSIINIYLNEVYFPKYFAECKRKIHSENFKILKMRSNKSENFISITKKKSLNSSQNIH
jgi:hypothetical protein